jgi:hypothetical protein
MIQHEDDLRNQRLGYLLTLNGFLFAALGFAWNARQARSLVLVLSIMGILIAVSSFVSMILSDAAIRYLRCRAPIRYHDLEMALKRWAELQSIPVAFSSKQIQTLVELNVLEDPDRAQAPRWNWERALQPWHAVPVILGLAWGAILGLAFVFLSWR